MGNWPLYLLLLSTMVGCFSVRLLRLPTVPVIMKWWLKSPKRWYYTPFRLTKIFPSGSPLFWWERRHTRILLHILWGCPRALPGSGLAYFNQYPPAPEYSSNHNQSWPCLISELTITPPFPATRSHPYPTGGTYTFLITLEIQYLM